MIRVRSVGQASTFAPATVVASSGMSSGLSVERKVTAAGVLFAGLGSALSLYLFATGKQQEAFAIGIASALVGSIVGFVRVLGEGE